MISEGKAALAGDALLVQTQQQATALMALLMALSAEKPVEGSELSQNIDACGAGLGARCKELRKLATEQSEAMAAEIEGNLKLLEEYLGGVGSCAGELDAAKLVLGSCWSDGSRDLKLGVSPMTHATANGFSATWVDHLSLQRSWV